MAAGPRLMFIKPLVWLMDCFGRWTLRDKAAQRRLVLLLAFSHM